MPLVAEQASAREHGIQAVLSVPSIAFGYAHTGNYDRGGRIVGLSLVSGAGLDWHS